MNDNSSSTGAIRDQFVGKAHIPPKRYAVEQFLVDPVPPPQLATYPVL